ncbi:MAG: response regulator [Crocinitomicaceae bacterium]
MQSSSTFQKKEHPQGVAENVIDFSILIVDDSTETLCSMEFVLNNFDYSVHTAQSGQEALELIEKNNYHLIFLDVRLPDIDGFAVAESIRSKIAAEEIAVIFMTFQAENREAIIKKGLQYGATDFMFKPLDIDILQLRTKIQYQRVRQIQQLKDSHHKLMELSGHLKNKSKRLSDSINYAKLIQQKILPTPVEIESRIKDCFVFYQPKHAIGGDFFMVEKMNSRQITICADCTGHGVPGALLSMLGHTIINDLLHSNRIFDPGNILTELNQKLLAVFQEDDAVKGHGMDLSVVVYRLDTHELTYASAKRPILIQQDNEVHQLKGDPYSIGDPEYANKSFQTMSFELKKAAWIYQYSDGITDQFGGSENKKYGSRKFRDFITHLEGSPLEKKEKITKELKSWVGSCDQTDDQTLLVNYLSK